MAGITGLGTTFNLPNYVGELFNVSPEDTPFLSAIGGLTGGVAVNSTVFTWSQYDLRDAADDRQRLEGADAPTAEARVRAAGSNVVEIHQEQVAVSYTKQAATNQFAGTAPFVGGMNEVTDELAWQLQQEFKQIARDVEKSFISGTYQMPANNSSARKTRGLLEAIETNVKDVNGATLTKDDVLDLMQQVWENGGIQESETRTLMVNATLKRKLTGLFITSTSYASYQETSRNVGGVTSCCRGMCRRTRSSWLRWRTAPRRSWRFPGRAISSLSRSPRPAPRRRCRCTARSVCVTATSASTASWLTWRSRVPDRGSRF